jgi:hypothetical protein
MFAVYVGCAIGRAVAGSAALWCLRLDWGGLAWRMISVMRSVPAG